MSAECGCHIVQIDRKAFGFNNQCFNLGSEKVGPLDSRRPRQFRDNGSNTGARFQQTVVQQLRDHLVRGVGIDLQLTRKHPDRGERFPSAKLPGDDSARRRVDSLFRDGNAGPECDAKRDHNCTNTSSTP